MKPIHGSCMQLHYFVFKAGHFYESLFSLKPQQGQWLSFSQLLGQFQNVLGNHSITNTNKAPHQPEPNQISNGDSLLFKHLFTYTDFLSSNQDQGP